MDLGRDALGPDAPPPKIYHEQARKLLAAVVQVQLHFTHIYKEQGESVARLIQKLLLRML